MPHRLGSKLSLKDARRIGTSQRPLWRFGTPKGIVVSRLYSVNIRRFALPSAMRNLHRVTCSIDKPTIEKNIPRRDDAPYRLWYYDQWTYHSGDHDKVSRYITRCSSSWPLSCAQHPANNPTQYYWSHDPSHTHKGLFVIDKFKCICTSVQY